MTRLLLLIACPAALWAQNPTAAEIKTLLQADPLANKILQQTAGSRNTTEIKELFEGDLEMASLILRRSGARFTPKTSAEVRKEFFDQLFPKINQPTAAASASSAASTSAVSGSGVPMIIGVALERGGITQSTKGSIVTFKGNLLGLARGLGSSDAYCLALQCGAKEDFLRRFTFGVGFDTNRNATETGAATLPATGQPVSFSLRSAKEQFDNFSVRYDLENRRDIRGKHFQADWDKRLSEPKLLEAAAALAGAQEKLVSAEILSNAKAKAETALQTAQNLDEMTLAIDQAVSAGALAVLAGTAADSRLSEFQKAHLAYATLLDAAARAAVQKFSHAIEFTYTRPKNQPELANLRYVGSGGFGANEEWRGTVNAALDFYASKAGAPNVGTFRDVQLSAQLDLVFFAKRPLTLTWSLAGYYQWMKERALIVIPAGDVAPGTNIPLAGPAVTLLAPEGNIGLAQCKFTFAVRDTKFKFPLSFTYANRTELIKPKHNVWGGQFGISYDFDSLFKP